MFIFRKTWRDLFTCYLLLLPPFVLPPYYQRFVYFFTVIAEAFILEKRLGKRLCLQGYASMSFSRSDILLTHFRQL